MRPPAWVGVVAVMALLVGGGIVFLLGAGSAEGPPPDAGSSSSSSVRVTTTDPPDTARPGSTLAPPTTLPWVPETVPIDAIVYDSPALIRPDRDIVEFRGEAVVQTLVLSNTGGGAGNWQLSVQVGSGLEVSPAEGQLAPDESVEVRILLDRANGRDLTDWAENITMIAGGSSALTNVKVKIFEI